MRPFWKGAITFGLVTVPVSLYSATRSRDLSFRQLHAKDKSPIDYRRFCEAEDVEVPWSDIVKGYEYEGKQIRLPAPRKAPKVVDLMKALQESLRAKGAAPKRRKVRRAA